MLRLKEGRKTDIRAPFRSTLHNGHITNKRSLRLVSKNPSDIKVRKAYHVHQVPDRYSPSFGLLDPAILILAQSIHNLRCQRINYAKEKPSLRGPYLSVIPASPKE